MSKRLIPLPKVASRYSVHRETVKKWERDPGLGFPQSLVIRKRRYFDCDELDSFDARQKRKPDLAKIYEHKKSA